MSEAGKTKVYLAKTLKSMMSEIPFEQITVTMLCDRCGINRKSFYYHYKDKYDVINWIFDTEFREYAELGDTLNAVAKLECCSRYLYDNRAFYSKALEIRGQNSFSEHFRETIYRLIKEYYRATLDKKDITEFQIDFFSDAIAVAFHRWLCREDSMTTEEFLEQLLECARLIRADYDKLGIEE